MFHPHLRLGIPLAALLPAASQAQAATSAGSATTASTAPETQAVMLRPPAPEPSGPLDIPWTLWIVLGTCAVLGTAGLTVSWQQKRRKQRRPMTAEMFR